MTTFERTWQQDNGPTGSGRVPADQTSVAAQGKSCLWYIKAFWMGQQGGATNGLATMYYSCDGTTAGTPGDGVDRWTSTYDPTKIIRAASGVAHSWAVLYSATLGLYCLIDYVGTQDFQVTFTWSRTAFTGGSTTVAPTSTTSWTYGAQQFIASALTGAHMFGLLATTGDMHIKFGLDGSGQCQFGISAFALMNTKTGETANSWTMIDYSTTGVWKRARLGANSITVKGRNAANTVNVIAGLVYLCYTNAAGVTTPVMQDVGNADATDGNYDDSPMYVYVDTAGSKSLRGRVADIMWCPDNAATPSPEPQTGPPYQSCTFGHTYQPFNASVSPSL